MARGKNQGIHNVNAKLTEEDVRFIRDNCNRSGGVFPVRNLAEMLGVSYSTVWNAATRKTWRHLFDQNERGEKENV